MFTHVITRSYTDSSGTAIAAQESVSADTESNFDGAITGTDQQIVYVADRSSLKSLLIKSDVACTLYTNDLDSGSPDDTIPLLAGQAIVWTLAQDGLSKCPFSVDITQIYVNVPSGTAALKIRALLDVTP